MSTVLGRLICVVVVLSAFASPARAQRESGEGLGRPPTAGEATREPTTETSAYPTTEGAVQNEPGLTSGYPTTQARERSASGLSSSEVQMRLSWLDTTWGTLAVSGGSKWVSAIPSFIFGAVYIGVGIAMQVGGPPYDTAAPYMYAYGGISIARPIARLILIPNVSDRATNYLAMPRNTPDEAVAQMRYGEEQLESLAHSYFLARVIGASVNMAAGVGLGVVFLAASGFSFPTAYSYLLLIAPAISIVSGVIQLFSTSGVEQRWNAYEKMRDTLRERRRRRAGGVRDLRSPTQPSSPSISVGVGLGSVVLYGSF
jgi:hypothetical protein